MKKRRIFVIGIVFVIFATCFSIMNYHYDRLARYPYEDEHARELILEHLTDEEINYIIEYALEPPFFINYIEAKDFNIYHSDLYNLLKEKVYYLSNEDVVYYTELFIVEGIDINIGATYLNNYSIDEINYWFVNKDLYIPGSYLVEYPDSFSINLTKDNTISTHIPSDLVEYDNDILARQEVLKEYESMCNYINEEYKTKNNGGIKIVQGYISYEDQQEIYNENNDSNIPGHDIHQTGLALDINLDSSIFKDKTDEFDKILQKFNFVHEDTCKNEYYHIRYKIS